MRSLLPHDFLNRSRRVRKRKTRNEQFCWNGKRFVSCIADLSMNKRSTPTYSILARITIWNYHMSITVRTSLFITSMEKKRVECFLFKRYLALGTRHFMICSQDSFFYSSISTGRLSVRRLQKSCNALVAGALGSCLQKACPFSQACSNNGSNGNRPQKGTL